MPCQVTRSRGHVITEVLKDVIFAQPLKVTSEEKMARTYSHGFVVAKKLHCLAESTYSGVSTLMKKLRDVG